MPNNAENLFDLTSLGLTDPGLKSIDLSKARPGLLKEISTVRVTQEKEINPIQRQKLKEALDRQTDKPSDPNYVIQELLAQLVFSGDKEIISELKQTLVDVDLGGDFTPEQYDYAAKIIKGAPAKREYGRSDFQPTDMEQAIKDQFQGNEELAAKALPHIAEGGMLNYSDPLILMEQQRKGLEGWRILRDGFVNVWVPDYYGLPKITQERLLQTPEGLKKLNEQNSPDEWSRLARQIRTAQFVVTSLTGRGIPLQALAQYAAQAYGSEGGDGPELFSKVGEGMYALQNYYNAITRNTEKGAGEVIRSTPDEMSIQAVLSAAHIPLRVQQKSLEDDGAGKMVEKTMESAVMFGAGELLGMYEGEGRVEIKRDAEGYTYFIDAAGNERTMKDLTEQQRRSLLKDETIRLSYVEGKSPYEFGRHVPGEREHTQTVIENERAGLGPILDYLAERLKKQGIDAAKINKIYTTHTDGRLLDLDHPYIQEYIAEKGNDVEEGSKRLLLEAAVRHVAFKNSALHLAEIMQLSWDWDPAKLKNNTPELADKGMRMWQYDEYYANNPGYWRPFVQPFLNPWTSWKKGNVNWLDIAMKGNPDNLYLPSRNPLRLDDAPIIQPLRLIDGTAVNEIKDENKKKKILNVLGATRYERSRWRTQVFKYFEGPNVLVEQAKKGVDRQKVISLARVQFDDYIDTYGNMAPQEFPRDSSGRIAVTDNLLKDKREAIAEINFKPQLEMFTDVNHNLPAEEYMGIFGYQRINEVDSIRHTIVAGLEHVFKYTGVYTEVATAQAGALKSAFQAMNNAINPQIEALMGKMPDRLEALAADQAFEALFKQAINLSFSLAGAKKPGEALKFVDEFAEAMVKNIYPTMGYTGEAQLDNVEDIIIYAHTLKEKAVDLVYLDFKNTKLGIHTDPTQRLELDSDMDVSQMKLAQEALTISGCNVVFHNNADPSDYIKDLADKKILPENLKLNQSDSESVKLKKLNEARKLTKAKGFKYVNPYVRWGLQLQQKIKLNDNLTKREIGSQTVLGLYGHRGGEKLWLIRVMDVLQDKMIIPITTANSIFTKAGISKNDIEEARNSRAEDIQKELDQVIKEMQKRAQELNTP